MFLLTQRGIEMNLFRRLFRRKPSISARHYVLGVAHGRALNAADAAWHEHKGTPNDLAAMAEAYLSERSRIVRQWIKRH
jgi:hypothetical protein